MKAIKKSIFLPLVFLTVFSITGCGPSYYVATDVSYDNPEWAPPYYQGVRYYYLPDIGVYYDLSARQFVYPDNGQWLFAASLPGVYGDYDLNNAYTVALDKKVYQPWAHHQYYAEHYPRYYYRTVYHDRDVTTIRGFNENEKKPVYWRDEDKSRLNNPQTRSNSNTESSRVNNNQQTRPNTNESNRGNNNDAGRNSNSGQNGSSNNPNKGNNNDPNRNGNNQQSGSNTNNTNKGNNNDPNRTGNNPQNGGNNNSPNKGNDHQPNGQNNNDPNKPNGQQNNDHPEKKLENPQRTAPVQPSQNQQQPNYSGKKLGQPVRVKPQMRENKRKKKMDTGHHQ